MDSWTGLISGENSQEGAGFGANSGEGTETAADSGSGADTGVDPVAGAIPGLYSGTGNFFWVEDKVCAEALAISGLD